MVRQAVAYACLGKLWHMHGNFDINAGWGEFCLPLCTDNALSERLVVPKMPFCQNDWAERRNMVCIAGLVRVKDGLHTCDV